MNWQERLASLRPEVREAIKHRLEISFQEWVKDNERDPNYQNWLAVVAEPLTEVKSDANR